MSRPTFSIVMTVLNGAATLEACLQSIAAQTFQDWELVLIDGGSTDATPAIAARHADVVTQWAVLPGIGLYAGLNAGIDRARGEWLYFMGCDDQLAAPDVLTRVADALAQAAPARVVAGAVRYAAGGYVMTPRFGSPYRMAYRLHHQGVFYHRSLFDAGLRYNETLRISADYELNTRLALAHTPARPMDVVVALYGEAGISSQQFERSFQEQADVNRRLFHGAGRWCVQAHHYVQRSVWQLRHRLGLLNLRARWQRS